MVALFVPLVGCASSLGVVPAHPVPVVGRQLGDRGTPDEWLCVVGLFTTGIGDIMTYNQYVQDPDGVLEHWMWYGAVLGAGNAATLASCWYAFNQNWRQNYVYYDCGKGLRGVHVETVAQMEFFLRAFICTQDGNAYFPPDPHLGATTDETVPSGTITGGHINDEDVNGPTLVVTTAP